MKKHSRKAIDRVQIDNATHDKYEEIAGFIKKLAQKGNLRHIVVRKPNDQVFMEVPLTAGIVVGSLFLHFAPTLTALIALVALFKQISVDIVRIGGSE